MQGPTVEFMKTIILNHFAAIQLGLLLIFIYLGYRALKSAEPESRFKVREADLKRKAASSKNAPKQAPQASEKNAPVKPIPNLPGIRLAGDPHEILGVALEASEDEIQQAFRELMKRYHPDRVESLAHGQRAFYEVAARVVIVAKDAMLLKNRK